jgi:hypothetical protein
MPAARHASGRAITIAVEAWRRSARESNEITKVAEVNFGFEILAQDRICHLCGRW